MGVSKIEGHNTAIGIAVLSCGIFAYRPQPNKIKAFRNRYYIGIVNGGGKMGVGMLVLRSYIERIPNTAPQCGPFYTGWFCASFKALKSESSVHRVAERVKGALLFIGQTDLAVIVTTATQ